MSNIDLHIKKLDANVPTPTYAYLGDAGFDVVCTEEIVLAPGERKLVPTGIAIAVPRGYAGFLQPRSGLANKLGLSIVNTPGLIDADYRGEIKAILLNTDKENEIRLEPYTRIAQLVIQAIPNVNIVIVDELDDTNRGAAGFGSSGIN